MPTSATSAPPRHLSADRAPASLRSRTLRGASRLGFTLIEVLIALSIIAMVAAVAVPSLARRLDLAFSDADLQQARPARSCCRHAWPRSASTSRSTRRRSPSRYPTAIHRWTYRAVGKRKVETPARLSRSGTCEAGSLVLLEPTEGRRWRFDVARLTCEVGVTALAEGAP